MPLAPDVCYRALQARDPRFDGRFFTAVRSTGIYCRPICPARTPRRDNCLFLPCAAAAEAAGFRPCRRCRPEAAPGTPAWQGTSATVRRGLRLIADGLLDREGVGGLADRLGVGERHLRRLFVEHLGASPVAIAQTRRSHFAAQLLRDTDWPVPQVAFAAGFKSVRRFNESIRQAFERPPRELRGRGTPSESGTIRLRARAPFDAHALLDYLSVRAIPGVERVHRGALQRVLRIGDARARIEVRPAADPEHLIVQLHAGDAAHWMTIADRTRDVFDLAADPAEITEHLGRDPLLAQRLAGLPGPRVPGAWDPFETTLRILLGQQITVAGASTLCGRLAARFGERLEPPLADSEDGAVAIAFPCAEALVDAPIEEIGMPRRRADAVREVARAVVAGQLDLGPGADPEHTREQLLALPGIGPWTAELVLLRALREPDAFPAGDLGLCKALDTSPKALAERAEAWRPWRGYAAMLLWQTPAAATQRRAG